MQSQIVLPLESRHTKQCQKESVKLCDNINCHIDINQFSDNIQFLVFYHLTPKREEKKILQVEFSKHIEKIQNPEFMEVCCRQMPAIAQSMRYSVFKCLQKHGDAFFKLVFEGLGKKSENYRIGTLKLIEQLSDPYSYPYLFPYLLAMSLPISPL